MQHFERATRAVATIGLALIFLVASGISVVMERLIFKHRSQEVFLVADTYRGAEIKRSLADFFDHAAGRTSVPIDGDNLHLRAGGSADLQEPRGWRLSAVSEMQPEGRAAPLRERLVGVNGAARLDLSRLSGVHNSHKSHDDERP
jgi:hypothetical protein